jgi:hypothetical protein
LRKRRRPSAAVVHRSSDIFYSGFIAKDGTLPPEEIVS